MDYFENCDDYLDSYRENEVSQHAASLEFRRNVETMLQFVQENKIIGTRSTGNMPLKMVGELSKKLVNPPKLETKIGERIYKVRSEEEVWSIFFPHILVEVGKLVKISPGRQWQLTPAGKKFLNQLCILIMIWWHRVNWLIAYPVEGTGENLPQNFQFVTLQHFLSVIEKNEIRFEDFADSIIESSGLTWTSSDKTFHQINLRGAVEFIVIEIHSEFGILETHHEVKEEYIGKNKTFTTEKLVSFRITKLGKLLIESILKSVI
ncbi:MAG: hypothetical protein R6V04_08615 [bacterium]